MTGEELPEWFVRLLDDRFAGIEKRQSEFVLDVSTRLDRMERHAERRLSAIERAQGHLDKCLDAVKKVLPDHEARMKHLERIVYGAAALVLVSAVIHLVSVIYARPHETPRAVEYPTTPYRGGPR